MTKHQIQNGRSLLQHPKPCHYPQFCKPIPDLGFVLHFRCRQVDPALCTLMMQSSAGPPVVHSPGETDIEPLRYPDREVGSFQYSGLPAPAFFAACAEQSSIRKFGCCI